MQGGSGFESAACGKADSHKTPPRSSNNSASRSRMTGVCSRTTSRDPSPTPAPRKPRDCSRTTSFPKSRPACAKSRRTSSAGNFEFKTSLEDIHMNIEAELTRRIGPAGRETPHRPLAQRPGRHRHAALRPHGNRRDCSAKSPASSSPCSTARKNTPPPSSPATPTSSAANPSPPATISSPTSRCWSATNPASRIAGSASTFPRSAPARSPAPPSTSTATPSPRNSASTASRKTRWMPSPTATTSPSCFSSSRSAARTSRASART